MNTYTRPLLQNLRQKTLGILFFIFFSFSLVAQLNVETNELDATYEVGDAMTFQVTSNSTAPISWVLKYDKHAPIISSGVINGSSGTVSYTGTHPGAVLCEVIQGNNKAIASAVFDPFDIQPFEQEPADFDAFWNSQKALLAGVPINPVVTLYSTTNYSKTYRVTLDQIDGRKVYGYLSVPNGVGPFPGVVVMPPYGNVQNIALPETDLAEKGGMLALAISIHNAPPDQVDPNAYQPDDYSDREGNYYRYAYLAGVRAIDYIFSRSDFDGENFVMSGVSQGAGLATCVAGLDNRVDLLTISNPALCQTTGLAFDREASFPNYILQSRNNFGTAAHEAATREASKYYDATFFARRFDGPSMVMLSYEDVVTPAATGFAAFNQLEGPKIVVHSTELDHSHPYEYWVGRFEFYRRHLPNDTAPFPWNPNTTGYYIDAGADVSVAGSSLALSGSIEYNMTNNPNFELNWRKISGPGDVSFSNSNSYNPLATFSDPGNYVLEFRGRDNALLNTNEKFISIIDYITVTVGSGGGDVTPPTAALTTSSNNVTTPFVVNLNFSETISGLSTSDLQLINGTASNLSGSGSNYSFVVTPIAEGQVSITLPPSTVADLSGNQNTSPSNTVVVSYSTGNTDTTPPVATLSTPSNSVTGAFDITIDFSETISGLTISDFVSTNGTLSGLVGSGANYSMTVTPIASGQVVVFLPDGTVVDAAGNANNASSNVIAVTYTPNTGDCNSPINLAFNKVTTQVSTQFNAIGGRAVDGITDGDFWVTNSTSLTSWVQNAWWEVDLGAVADITDIKIWNRSDCCSNVLADYHVIVSDVPFTSTNLNITLAQTGVSDFFQNTEAGYPSNIPVNRSGRYVRVQLDDQGFLALAEVEVMGCFSSGTTLDQNITFASIPNKLTIDNPFPVAAAASSGLPITFNVVSGPASITAGNLVVLDGTPGVVVVEANQAGNANYNPAPSATQSFTVAEPSTSDCDEVTNLAVGKTSTQQGTQLSADASRANDGNINGDFWNGNSVSLTNWTPNAWWEVDLGEVGDIEKINIYNRTDCCSDRLKDYYVLVSDVPFTSTNLNATIAQTGVSDFFQSQEAGSPTEINIGRTGRYVRVQLQGTSFLAIAEVEVMGCFDNGGCEPAGTACDDNDPTTENDVEDGNCNCAGTPCPIVGTVCDDGDANTENDVEDGECNCAGTPISCPIAGTACDDNDPTTENDVEDGNCNCVGTPCPVVGTVCDDGDANTENDIEDGECNCAGTPILGGCTSTSNVALNKPVSQISTLSAGGIVGSPSKAIDGNTNGIFFTNPTLASSVTATQFENEAWWEVDLEDLHFIEEIKVYNRTDGVDRSRDCYVLVSETPFTSDDLDGARAEADFEYFISGLVGSPDVITPQMEGQYVRVHQSGGGYLVLAEVEVMGCISTSINSNNNINTLIALPLTEFLLFDGAKKNRSVELNWITNMEAKNDFFIIEKSMDGINFEYMTEVESKSNSFSPVAYFELDSDPYFGKNYYRLRQNLNDGTEIYSNIFEVEFELDLREFAVFPNPAKDMIYANLKSFEGKKGKIQIYDSRGVLVEDRNIESIQKYPEAFDVKKYVNGLYIMSINIEGQKLITKQILVKNLY